MSAENIGFCVQDYLQQSFSRYANCVALKSGEAEVSYKQLNTQSQLLANLLIELSSDGKNKMVSCFFKSQVNYLVALLACMKARCIFVPFNSQLSYDENMARNRQLPILCCLHDDVCLRDQSSCCYYDLLTADLSSEVDEYYVPYDCDDPVYVYFTSGTSANPKAILGRNGSLAHFIEWETSEFKLSCNVKVLQLMSPVFDPYLRDVLVPLCVGGEIVFLDQPIQNTHDVLRLLADHSISLIHITPSYMNLLLRASKSRKKIFESMSFIFFAGERLSATTANESISFFPNAKVINLYGPTETTLAKAFYVVHSPVACIEWIPIGAPIRDSMIYVMGDSKLCEENEIGELCIETQHASFGYYNEQAVSAQRFRASPFRHGYILYHTGDMGYYDHNEQLHYVGRMDRQTKIAGVMTSFPLLENLIMEYSNVDECVVCEIEAIGLVAYYTSELVVDVSSIRSDIIQHIGKHAVIKHFIKLSSFPLNVNGKKNTQILSLISFFEQWRSK